MIEGCARQAAYFALRLAKPKKELAMELAALGS
jgi:hypothetical protein